MQELTKEQELNFELVDIESVEDNGYANTFDISVTGKHDFILGNGIITHNSALAGLTPSLGREQCAYYCLKGKPLNVWSASQSKFTSNKELSTLYKIVKSENFEKIVYASDQDLDGFHIRALLSGFINKYLPEYKERTGMLETPIIGFLKAQKLQRWSYDLDDESKTKPGEVPFYYKGLGSWEKEDLKKVVKTDGLEKMIKMLDFNSEESYNSLDEWLGDDSEPRKKHILENDFNIADV